MCRYAQVCCTDKDDDLKKALERKQRMEAKDAICAALRANCQHKVRSLLVLHTACCMLHAACVFTLLLLLLLLMVVGGGGRRGFVAVVIDDVVDAAASARLVTVLVTLVVAVVLGLSRLCAPARSPAHAQKEMNRRLEQICNFTAQKPVACATCTVSAPTE